MPRRNAAERSYETHSSVTSELHSFPASLHIYVFNSQYPCHFSVLDHLTTSQNYGKGKPRKAASLIPSVHRSSLYSLLPFTMHPTGWIDAIPCAWRPNRFEESGTIRSLMPLASIKFVRIRTWSVYLVACCFIPLTKLYSGSVPKLSQMDFSECPRIFRRKGPSSSQGKSLVQFLSVCLDLTSAANMSRTFLCSSH